MKYRKKPVVIEARQFETNNEPGGCPNMDAIVEWVKAGGGDAQHDGTYIRVFTLEGTMTAMVGDWIIRGVQGEFYVCKPDIFEATYDVAGLGA